MFAVGMWVYVAYRVAQGGWSDLVAKYRAARSPSGRRVGAVSGRFPRSSYSSTLAVWIADEGFFIRPSVLFRTFHPALLIPWSNVVSVSEEKKVFTNSTLIECDVDGTPFSLELPGSYESDIRSHAPQTA